MQRNLKNESWMEVPDTDDQLKKNIAIAIYIERGKFVEPDSWDTYESIQSDIEQRESVSVPEYVTTKVSINDGYCRIFAERVYKRLGSPSEVSIESDEHRHTWLSYDGSAYDAETPLGVSHPSHLPVYNRF